MKTKPTLTMDAITNKVLRHVAIPCSVHDIYKESKERKRSNPQIAETRMALIYIMYNHGYTMQQIADYFGIHHTNICILLPKFRHNLKHDTLYFSSSKTIAEWRLN